MYKMTITYDDFNGQPITQDVYFNISKMEAIRIQAEEGGFAQYLEKLLAERDAQKLISTFEWFVQKAYGERTNDGATFTKVDENGNRLIDKFKNTQAYDEVLWRLCSSGEESAKFVEQVLPKQTLQDALAEASKNAAQPIIAPLV